MTQGQTTTRETLVLINILENKNKNELKILVEEKD